MFDSIKAVFRIAFEAGQRTHVALNGRDETDAPAAEAVSAEPEVEPNLFDRPKPIVAGPVAELYEDESGAWLARFTLRRSDPYDALTDWGPEVGRWGGHPIHKWIETRAGRFYRSLDATADPTPPDGWRVDGLPVVYCNSAGAAHVMTWLRQTRRYDRRNNPFTRYIRDSLAINDDDDRSNAQTQAMTDGLYAAAYWPWIVAHRALARRLHLSRDPSRRLWIALICLLFPVGLASGWATLPLGVAAVFIAESKQYYRETREEVETEHLDWVARHPSDADTQ
jgi:hypothetical protein